MNESQAWRALAEQFAQPANGQHYDKCLCWAIDKMHWSLARIDGNVAFSMRERINEQMPPDIGWAYESENSHGFTDNDESPAAREARSMAALWFALDARAEGK